MCQAWGIRPFEARVHVVHADVSLSVAGATYGSGAVQDIPLAVDLAGDRKAANCYFIADGREDPYGLKKFETSAARHMKALHLVLLDGRPAGRRRPGAGRLPPQRFHQQGRGQGNHQSAEPFRLPPWLRRVVDRRPQGPDSSRHAATAGEPGDSARPGRRAALRHGGRGRALRVGPHAGRLSGAGGLGSTTATRWGPCD